MEVTESIDQLVVRMIAAICGGDASQITLATALSELALDSLRITALAAHIQAQHDCDVTAQDVVELLEAPRVADIVTIVRKVMARATSAQS